MIGFRSILINKMTAGTVFTKYNDGRHEAQKNVFCQEHYL